MGYAAGYILGGLIGPALGWRAAFLLEAAAMLPFAAFCAFGPPLDIRGKTPRSGIGCAWYALLLHLFRVYALICNKRASEDSIFEVLSQSTPLLGI